MRLQDLYRKIAFGILAALIATAGFGADNPGASPVHRYKIFLLPNALGGPGAGANAINDLGWPMGFVANPAGNTVATAWIEGRMLAVGPIPGGSNSNVAWESVKNNQGLIVGISDTAEKQPRGEVFSCAAAGFIPASGNTCRGFLWEPPGKISELPTLGGDNAFATGINNFGRVIGWAETSYQDPSCVSPQVLQFLPFIYDIHTKQISALQVYPGDSDGTADTQNDRGQIAGISGICSVAVGGASARHAIFWESASSTPIDMGNLGGMAWNTPNGMNEKGEVVGFGNPSGDQNAPFNPLAFYWNQKIGMQNLGTLPPFANSIAYGINNRELIVGQLLGDPSGGFSHAFIYQNGRMIDMNSLMVGNPNLVLLYANDVNEEGVIVGGAINPQTGVSSAFAAVPFGTE